MYTIYNVDFVDPRTEKVGCFDGNDLCDDSANSDSDEEVSLG